MSNVFPYSTCFLLYYRHIYFLLIRYKEGACDMMPFYEAQLLAMAANVNSKIRLNFQHLKKYDLMPSNNPELADFVVNDLGR